MASTDAPSAPTLNERHRVDAWARGQQDPRALERALRGYHDAFGELSEADEREAAGGALEQGRTLCRTATALDLAFVETAARLDPYYGRALVDNPALPEGGLPVLGQAAVRRIDRGALNPQSCSSRLHWKSDIESVLAWHGRDGPLPADVIGRLYRLTLRGGRSGPARGPDHELWKALFLRLDLDPARLDRAADVFGARGWTSLQVYALLHPNTPTSVRQRAIDAGLSERLVTLSASRYHGMDELQTSANLNFLRQLSRRVAHPHLLSVLCAHMEGDDFRSTFSDLAHAAPERAFGVLTTHWRKARQALDKQILTQLLARLPSSRQRSHVITLLGRLGPECGPAPDRAAPSSRVR